MKKTASLICFLGLIVPTCLSAQNVPDYSTPPAASAGIPLPANNSGIGGNGLKFNYVRTWVPYGTIGSSVLNPATIGLNSPNCTVNTTYTNGWGQPLQQNQRTATRDIIIPYDNRATINKPSYLPFSAPRNSGFMTSLFADQKNWYASNYADEGDNAYGRTLSEANGNDRTVTVYGPGASLTGSSRGTVASSDINTSGSAIKRLVDNGNGGIAILGDYADGELVVSKTEGQHGALSLVYTNKSGQTVCKMVKAESNTFLSTYYVYDDFDRIIWIITPKAVDATQGWGFYHAIPLGLCYHYQYNEYGQVVEKTTPGKATPELTVYDQKHRPVLTQTPLLAAQQKWAFQVYDSRGRVVFSGFVNSNNDTRASFQAQLDNGTPNSHTLMYYLVNECNDSYPKTLQDCEINSYSYYDHYNFPSPLAIVGRSFDTRHNTLYLPGVPKPSLFAQGLLTAKLTRVIGDSDMSNQWISSVQFYDIKGQPLQIQTLNPWNTTEWDITTTRVGFNGQLLQSISDIYGPEKSKKPSTRIVDYYNYDANTGRITSVKRGIDNADIEDIATYTYDDLGRVARKVLGNIENQKYTYDIGGRMTGINKDYVDEVTTPDVTFGCSLFYDHGFSQPRYDGAVSGLIWRGSGSAAPQRSYGYLYDEAGRMTAADFFQHDVTQATTGPQWEHAHTDFSVSNMTYDPNGNILTMKQRGTGVSGPVDMDDLTYSYLPNSNSLEKVEDAVTTNFNLNDFTNGNTGTQDYQYDEDGNLKADNNKGIGDITYNVQDLPLAVAGPNGSTVANTYAADGTLLEKKMTTGSKVKTYRYIGPLVYNEDDLEYALHPEGRSRWLQDSLAWKFDYFVKDHLGNVRTIVTNDNKNGGYEYLATYELPRAVLEGSLFEQVAELRDTKPGSTDPDDQHIGVLDGNDPAKRIGTSLLLKVMAGDQFDLSMEAAYIPPEGTPVSEHVSAEDMIGSLVSALSGSTTVLPGGESGAGNAGLISHLFSTGNVAAGYDGLKEAQTDPSQPRAYLNYLFFDEDMHFVPDQSGVIQVTQGSNGSWAVLSSNGRIVMNRNGYFNVFASTEDYNVPVLIDNMKVTYSRGRLLEEQHYYPHGLVVVDGKQNPVTNRYLYQGKELQDEAGLQLYDFHARQYDPQIGRFWGIDPMDQFPSGYVGMGNDPANQIDPDGMASIGSGGTPGYNMQWSTPFYEQGGGNGDLPGDSFDGSGYSTRGGGAGGDIMRSEGQGRGSWIDAFQAKMAYLNGQKEISSRSDGGEHSTANDHTQNDVYEAGVGDGIGNIKSGFVGGAEATVNGIKSMFSVEGYVRSLIDPFGAQALGNQIGGIIMNIQNYKRADFEYGAGFAGEKLLEIAILRKISGRLGSVGTAAEEVSAGENALVKTLQYDIPGHGAQRLVQRGISEKMAQTAIRKGNIFYDPKNGTINYILEGGFGSGKDLLIGTNPINGAIKTGIRGTNLVRPRMIPIQ